MVLNVLSTRLLAEAIKNSLVDPDLLHKYCLNFEEGFIVQGLEEHLADLGVVLKSSKHSRTIYVTDKQVNGPLSIHPYVVVIMNDHEKVLASYPLDKALRLSKKLKARLMLHEFIGKPEIQKKNLFFATMSALLLSGRFTSKIHVSILNFHIPYSPNYESSSTFNKRGLRLLKKLSNVIRYRFEIIKGRITYNPLIQKIYISWVEHTALRNIDTQLPRQTAHDPAHTIAIAMAWFDSGGVERVVLNLIKDLNTMGYRVHIITTIPGEHPWDHLFKSVSASVVHLPEILGKYRYTSLAEHVFCQWLNKTGAGTLLITNSLTAYRALPYVHNQQNDAAPKVFDVLHTHGTQIDDDAFLKLSMPYIKYIDKRVVIDKYLKDYYVEKYDVDPSSIEIIYNGLDRSIQEKKIDAKKDSTMDGKTHIAYMGRLDPDKSPLRMVEIARHLRDTSKGTAIVDVYGDGSLAKSMHNLSSRYGLTNEHIVFHGRSDSALEDIARADFSILVSDNEGIPMSILEAMHVGTPCIAPAVGGIPEMVDDEVDGFLFHYTSEDEQRRLDSIFFCVDRAIRANQSASAIKSMSKSGKKKVNEKFGDMASQYDQLIKYLHDEPKS